MIDYIALCEKLESDGLGVVGKDITFDIMPVSVSKGLCVRSNISGNDIDYEIPGLARGTFRLISRASKYQEGEWLLHRAIESLLVSGMPEIIGSMRVRYCRPETTCMSFPVSDGNLREFAVTMAICYEFDTTNCPWVKHV